MRDVPSDLTDRRATATTIDRNSFGIVLAATLTQPFNYMLADLSVDAK